MVKQVEKEIEISVLGGASQMESEMSSRGLSVRRMGRNRESQKSMMTHIPRFCHQRPKRSSS